MPLPSHPLPFRHARLALLPALLLTGCATQQAMDEQTQPLRDQLVQLQQSIDALSGTVRQEAEAGRTRSNALAGEVAGLGSELKTVRDAVTAQAGRLDQAEGKIAELATAARTANERLATLHADSAAQQERMTSARAAVDGRVAATEQRLVEAESTARDTAERLSELTARLASDQARDDATRTVLAGRVASAEQRLEAVAGAVEETALQADELAAELGDLDLVGEGLEQRLGGAEQRLDEVAEQARAGAEALAALTGRVAQAEREITKVAGAVQDPAERMAALAGRLDRVEAEAGDASALARRALALAAQNDILINGKVIHTVTLTEDKTLYPLNSPDLGARDRASLDGLVKFVEALKDEYHLEIQGHTDNIGVDDYTYALGKARAEVVKRYLHETGGVSLGRMSVISYGASVPLRPGAMDNRRIVLHVRVLDRPAKAPARP